MNFLYLSDTEHIIYFANSIFMFLNFLFIFFSSLRIVPKKRIFHYFLSHITLSSSIAYGILSNNLLTSTNFDGKLVYHAKYLEWILTTPVQLIILGKMGQVSYPNIYILSFLTDMMCICGWIGELATNDLKWIYFSMGMILLYPIYVFLFEDFDFQVVKEFSGDYIAKKYYWMGKALLFVWIFYPFIWLLDNVNLLSNLGTSICYSISDFLSKVVFSMWILNCVNNSHFIGETIMSLENNS